MADTTQAPTPQYMELQNNLSQAQVTIKHLNAQITSLKNMMGETLDSNLQCKSNIILLQQDNSELNKKIEMLNSQIKVLGDKILELSTPKTETPDAANQVSE